MVVEDGDKPPSAPFSVNEGSLTEAGGVSVLPVPSCPQMRLSLGWSPTAQQMTLHAPDLAVGPRDFRRAL